MTTLGVDHPSKNPEVMKKIMNSQSGRRRYEYAGYKFMSLPEFAFAVFCVDHDIKFTYEDEAYAMDYVDAHDKQHAYFPDFHISEACGVQCDFLVEIKGNNHFKDKDPTKEFISFKGPKYDHIEKAKWLLIKKAGVILLSSANYKPYVDYVKTKYGNKFIKEHRIEKKTKEHNSEKKPE